VHISDLHISEHLLRGADQKSHIPHRYWHDVTAFLALDQFLKTSPWDLLLITGDVSRIGITRVLNRFAIGSKMRFCLVKRAWD